MANINAQIPELLQRLYEIVGTLESLFPKRKFTPDGHLVGSLGEVIAAHDYGLALLPASTETHDALKGNIRIKIKATQGRSIALRGDIAPDHLLVLRLLNNGTTEEIYNGPGAPAWQAAGRLQKNGQRPISLKNLKVLMSTVVKDGLKLNKVQP